jgi:hypothetical protein
MQARAEKTRDKMRRGGLPAPFAAKPWRGAGAGDLCSGCADVITRSDAQVDIDVRGVLTLAFHDECYRAWFSFPDTP